MTDWKEQARNHEESANEYARMNYNLLEALKEIAKGEGAYSRDPLTHAGNVITNMKVIANQAIREAEDKS